MVQLRVFGVRSSTEEPPAKRTKTADGAVPGKVPVPYYGVSKSIGVRATRVIKPAILDGIAQTETDRSSKGRVKGDKGSKAKDPTEIRDTDKARKAKTKDELTQGESHDYCYSVEYACPYHKDLLERSLPPKYVDVTKNWEIVQKDSSKGKVPIVKGRLREHVSFWEKIGANKVVLDTVREGYRIPFYSIPPS